ncbi:YggS family pyridoxal phosphate-dependent enzyme [Phaeovibrio sulfidiphilus]|uniref:Pyridoxal phosphate homeostasis protein n=1 Tax=Phaeovibrio sulfidiphilus TaxID=1220600 RepID=A0A8J7CC15_9PROT|nr:YggS family pyridoxal phosphate-dependent enzyme [Phaeovibrio sulfidiphilus]MBE1236783.1 YggS family pyridoxal phosphate-dependent enzyme [Phaeovibrio sulfidiphilus]
MTTPETLSCPPLTRALESIRTACAAVSRPVSDVSLVAVSKTRPAGDILPLLKAGHQLFGENRVQEAQGKWPALREQFPDLDLHLIGPLQTNKVRDAVALFDAIDSVDRMRLAEALATEMERQDRRLPVLVQVNTGEEPQKAGVPPLEVDAFLERCRTGLGLNVQGLMCIPPVDEEPAPHFALLREIGKRHGLPVLSMGMSGDFETAIAFGATHIRLGTALFGERDPG